MSHIVPAMFQTYLNVTESRAIEGLHITVLEDVGNDYHTDQLPIIPKGTVIVGENAGDYGFYGMCCVNGAMHKVKVKLHEMHKCFYGEKDARSMSFRDF